MTAQRPNVILINCDDLGYGDLGCYGSSVHSTPALDRLATEGIRFTDFYMASPVCSPSRGAMMTGCYPPRIGFGDFDGASVLFPGHGMGLNPSETTIAKVLQSSGYATKMVGKWHCGDQPEFLPTRHGFDSYYGIPYSNDMGRQVGPNGESADEVADRYAKLGVQLPPLPLMLDEDVLEAQPDQAGLTFRYLDESLRFIRTNATRPFFLYLAHMYVHLPIYCAQRFEEASRNGAFGAAVETVDWVTSVLMGELERLGIGDNTLVIFTSDNGGRAREGGSNAPLRGTKAQTWEGGMRVPCIMRWPARIPAGTVCSEIVSSIDFLPTIARLCDAAVPETSEIDGLDVADLLVGASQTSPRETFYYYFGNGLEAVRAGRWKLHVAKGGKEMRELYDLSADVGETTDVAASHAEIVAQLESTAERAREDLGDERLGIKGSGVRPVGRVNDPVTLTTFDPAHPYYMAEYDIYHRG